MKFPNEKICDWIVNVFLSISIGSSLIYILSDSFAWLFLSIAVLAVPFIIIMCFVTYYRIYNRRVKKNEITIRN